MITIEKRKIELNIEEFRCELLEVCRLLKRHSPSTFGITIKGINEHFGIKLKTTDFYLLCEELGYKSRQGRRNRYLNFDDIGIDFDENKTSKPQ